MSTAKELKKEIERGVWDASLGKLYGRRAGVLERQRARYADALDCFAALYGGEREAAIYSAPGRTEIGGNHTDHNHGVVMAGAVDLDVIAVVSKNTDDVVRVKSKGFDGRDEVKLEQLSPVLAEQGRSAALIRGVAAGIAKQGGVLGGFDAYTTSDVLRGSGLSSSAAFEVVIGTVFNGEYNQGRFSAVDIAKISQYAENEYFGKPSGLMDQTACSVGSVITIDFRDPASPVVEKVDLIWQNTIIVCALQIQKGAMRRLPMNMRPSAKRWKQWRPISISRCCAKWMSLLFMRILLVCVKNWGTVPYCALSTFLRTVGVPVRYAVPSVRIALKTFWN